MLPSISLLFCGPRRTYSGENKEFSSSDFIKPDSLSLDRSAGDESAEHQPIKIQHIIGLLPHKQVVSKNGNNSRS